MSLLELIAKSEGRPEFLEQFCGAQRTVRDPATHALLPPTSQWMAFAAGNVPFPTEFWVARRDEQVLGRIGANVSPTRPGVGYVGFFESRDGDTAPALLRGALEWLRSRSVKKVYGPTDFSTWFNYRCRTDRDSHGPFVWEPHNPLEYVEWFTREGFKEIENYHTQGFIASDQKEVVKTIEMTRPALELAGMNGFSVRPIDPARMQDRELPILYRMSMNGFKDNFLFEPIDLPTFSALYSSVSGRVDYGLSHFALGPDGQEVGFLFALVDGPYAVIKSVAVLPELRKMGLSIALLHHTLRRVHDRGLKQVISALVRTGNKSEHLTNKGARDGVVRWVHRYSLYEKEIAQ